jgi:hypothetical protein
LPPPLLLLLLVGCAQTPVASNSVRLADPEQGAISWQAPAFRGAEQYRVIYSGVWQREEYLRYESADARGEMVMAAANPYKQVVLEYDLGLRRGVATWSFNRDREIEWGSEERLRRGGVLFFYEDYRLPAEDKSCFAFSASWNPKLDDQRLRPANVVFGYYCENGSGALPEQLVHRLIQSIAIARVDLIKGGWIVRRESGRPVAEPPPSAALPAQQPMVPASPDFPFRFARSYAIGGRGTFP